MSAKKETQNVLPTFIATMRAKVKKYTRQKHDIEAIAFITFFALFVIGVGVAEMINPWFLDRHQVAMLLFVVAPILAWFMRLLHLPGREEGEEENAQ